MSLLSVRGGHRSLLLLVVLLVAGRAGAAAQERLEPGRLHVRKAAVSDADAPTTPPDALPRHHLASESECGDCHRTHGTDAAIESRFAAIPRRPGPAGAHALRADDALDLCLACHDGVAGIPDVVGDDANDLESRSAGFFEAPGRRNPNGHDLGYGLQSQVGTAELCARCHSGPVTSARVTCVDCHDPHGNGRARNLRYASDPSATPILGLLVNPLARGLERYESESVAFGTMDGAQLREASSVCVDCHHAFSGLDHVDPNRDGIHERHPTYDSERGARNTIRQGGAKGSTDPAHWERGRGSGFGATPRLRVVTSGATSYGAARTVNAATNGVFCLSCHRAHGSDQPFGLVWTVGRDDGPAGCDQCHAAVEVASNATP